MEQSIQEQLAASQLANMAMSAQISRLIEEGTKRDALLMQTMQHQLAQTNILNQNKAEEIRKQARAPEDVRAADVAKATSSAMHRGVTSDGEAWWAQSRPMLRRLCPSALTMAEYDSPPEASA